MARRRVSRLQKRILRLLVAEQRRPQGGAASSHYELVKALGGDKGNISHSLRTLEERGWLIILRTPGGLRIPRESCHRFHGKVATDSTPNLPLIP
jgi:hypothetical protein